MFSQKTLRPILITFLWGIIFFLLFLFRFSPAQRWTTFFINKALAETTVVLLGLSFLLGPLCKISPFFIKHLPYRKYFGLFGFYFLLFHIVASLLQLNARFPVDWYLKNFGGMLAAGLAAFIFLVMTVTTHEKLIARLGGNYWKLIQRVGYFALFLALIHIFVATNARWSLWLSGKTDMPSSFLVFVFGVLVILARLAALVIDRTKPKS